MQSLQYSPACSTPMITWMSFLKQRWRLWVVWLLCFGCGNRSKQSEKKKPHDTLSLKCYASCTKYMNIHTSCMNKYWTFFQCLCLMYDNIAYLVYSYIFWLPQTPILAHSFLILTFCLTLLFTLFCIFIFILHFTLTSVRLRVDRTLSFFITILLGIIHVLHVWLVPWPPQTECLLTVSCFQKVSYILDWI